MLDFNEIVENKQIIKIGEITLEIKELSMKDLAEAQKLAQAQDISQIEAFLKRLYDLKIDLTLSQAMGILIVAIQTSVDAIDRIQKKIQVKK